MKVVQRMCLLLTVLVIVCSFADDVMASPGSCTPCHINVTVTSPNGGENWQVGQSRVISWNMSPSPFPSTMDSVEIQISTNGGSSWVTVTNNTPNDGSFTWTVPDTLTSNAYIRIAALYLGEPLLGIPIDSSNGNFTISVVAAPKITLTSPNGGENWQIGTTRNLTWNHSGNPGSNVKIEYSTSGGLSWTTITNSTPNDGSFNWTVPNVPTTSARARVTSTSNSSYTDTSNSDFSIISTAPKITLTSPNGGENWQIGTTRNLTWNRSGNPGSNVKIEYSTGGGLSWTTITNSTPNDGSFNWTVPNVPTTSARARVTSTSNSSYTDTSNSNFSISADGRGQYDIIINFGDNNGIWNRMNNNGWVQLHNLSPEIIETGDLDGNGQGEVIVDFGTGFGIWTWMNNNTWVKLHNLSAEIIETGDLDGNGKDDVIIDFGTGLGIWTWMNNSTWVKLHNLSAEIIETGDLDGNGKDDVIIDFGTGFGVRAWMNNSTLLQLHGLSPEIITTGDLDGNGKDEVIIDFGTESGIWTWMNNSTWVKLHNLSAEIIETGDLDGNGKDDVIIDFGLGIGIWTRMNNSTWVLLHGISAEIITTGDMDGNGKDEVIIDFGTGFGIWAWMNNSTLLQLSGVSAEIIATGDMDGVSGSLPTITQQPTSITVSEPNAATLTVSAFGNPALSYQWRKNGANINWATSNSYTLNPTSIANDNGVQFDVVVSNSQGSVTSQTVTLTVIQQLTDPIPNPIVKPGLAVKIGNFVQVPASSSSPPLARINLLYHSRDNTGRLFVNDLRGKLYVINSDVVTIYLDLASLHPNFVDTPSLGTGFSSFVFHPDFSTNGKFYTAHSETPGTNPPDMVSSSQLPTVVHNVIKEWTAGDHSANVFTGTSREILRTAQPTYLHAVQEIGFNPNADLGDTDYGILYIAHGDGETSNTGNPQDLSSPHGSILRIDPLGTNSQNGAYGILADNPFANDGDPDTLGEIWAFGFRNPHRFSWDTGGDGKMLIGDIGEKNIEEVELGKIGANYGWNEREGTFVFNKDNRYEVLPLPDNDNTLGFTYPVAQYDHDEGFGIVGGFVYRGTLIPTLVGKYIFGDIVNGRIFYVDVNDMFEGSQATINEMTLYGPRDNETTMKKLVSANRVDLRFGIDQQGEIYVMSKQDGKVRRLVAP